MSLDQNTLANIAHLARIHLDKTDIAAYTESLSSILNFIDQMKSVDTTGVQPLAHPLDLTQRLRADVVTEEDQRDRLQSNAPQVQDGFYQVPKVIEQAG